MNNNLRQSKHNSDKDDDLFSYGDADDLEENYMNKKQLIHLENEQSVTIDESLNEDEEYFSRISRREKSETPNNKKKKINHHEELLKFIADTSDILSDNNIVSNNHWNNKKNFSNNILPANLNFKPVFSTYKFELFLPSLYNQNVYNLPFKDERIFTLNSHSSSSFRQSNSNLNIYKEKFEMMEMKYKELFKDYNNILDSIKEWQMFYIKLFNIVSLPIPTEEFSYNAIFNNNYKEEIIQIVDNLVNRNMNLKISKNESCMLVSSIKKFDLNQIVVNQSEKVNFIKVKFYEEIKELKFSGLNFAHENDFSIKNKERKVSIISKVNEFGFINFKGNNLINYIINENNFYIQCDKTKVENSAETSKKSKTSDLNFNNFAPFSPKNNIVKKSNIQNSNIITNENFEIKKTEICKKFKKLNFTSFDHKYSSIIKAKFTKDTQTSLSKIDIEKLESLNEEYSEQLLQNKKEKEDLESFYTNYIEKMKEEQNSTVATIDYNLLYPEMIPPEQTFKIFLRKILLI